MADIFSNQQIASATSSTPVLNMEGKFVVSEVKEIAAMQERFHAKFEQVIPVDIIAEETNPFRALGKKLLRIVGVQDSPEDLAKLSDIVAGLRKEANKVLPGLTEKNLQSSPVMPMQIKPIHTDLESKKAA